MYGPNAVGLVAFIARARRLGFSVAEIEQIVALRRAGQAPCVHVQRLAREKIAALDGMLRDLRTLRRGLATLVAGPEVEIVDDEVRIGETGNLAVLKKDEWNILVGLIQSGRLGAL